MRQSKNFGTGSWHEKVSSEAHATKLDGGTKGQTCPLVGGLCGITSKI
jgi:hypothetical protein